VTASNAAAQTYTVPPQADVVWLAGAVLDILNLGAGTVTIAAGAGVTINGTPLTLATSKGGSLVRTASNTWTFIPFSAGEGAANFTNAATGTFSSGGIDYKYITFTGIGDLIVDQAGFADILVIGGGAGGGNSGSTYTTSGGAGGMLELSSVFFSAGSHSVTVGAGGVGSVGYAGSSGVDSLLGDYVAVGGGGGSASGSTLLVGIPGGSGSGAILATLSKGVTNQGNAGGTRSGGTGNAAGGGAGGAASVSTAGVGRASSITGASVTYAVGGSTATSQTANTGNGGGGAGSAVNGNSGLVIVRVVV